MQMQKNTTKGGHTDVVAVLIDAGADIELREGDCDTPCVLLRAQEGSSGPLVKRIAPSWKESVFVFVGWCAVLARGGVFVWRPWVRVGVCVRACVCACVFACVWFWYC